MTQVSNFAVSVNPYGPLLLHFLAASPTLAKVRHPLPYRYISGQIHTLAAFAPKQRVPSTQSTEGTVCPVARVDTREDKSTLSLPGI